MPDRASGEGPVRPGELSDGRALGGHACRGVPVDGVVILSADPVVVHPGDVRHDSDRRHTGWLFRSLGQGSTQLAAVGGNKRVRPACQVDAAGNVTRLSVSGLLLPYAELRVLRLKRSQLVSHGWCPDLRARFGTDLR